MKNLTSLNSTVTVLLTILLLASGSLSLAAQAGGAAPKQSGNKGNSLAAPAKPASAELAVKQEMVRKQQGQRITQPQRKTAAESLKAERRRVYDAKQSVKGLSPGSTENK